MADITSAIDKMTDVEIAANAPLTETLFDKMGANINALIDRVTSITTTTITASGTYNVPSTVGFLIVTGYGGGGGGAAGYGNNPAGGGGGGGFGAAPRTEFFDTTPSAAISVTVGSGGAGAVSNGFSGGNGVNTVFGSLTFLGGKGGFGIVNGTSVASGGVVTSGGGPGIYGAGNSHFLLGGIPGIHNNALTGGGGGAGVTATGGNGSSSTGSAGVAAASNSGAGGGGGMGDTTLAIFSAGGAGGSGRIVVYEFHTFDQ